MTIPWNRLQQDLVYSQFILALRASNIKDYFINIIKPRARTDGVCMQYVDAISIDIWNAGINAKLPCSKVCNCEDRYAITHARSDTLNPHVMLIYQSIFFNYATI